MNDDRQPYTDAELKLARNLIQALNWQRNGRPGDGPVMFNYFGCEHPFNVPSDEELHEVGVNGIVDFALLARNIMNGFRVS